MNPTMQQHGNDLAMRYTNSTVLVHNWYEERFQDNSALSSTGKTAKDLPTQDRMFCRDYPAGQPNDYTTTKQHTDKLVQTTPAPVKVKKPSMYTETNLGQRLESYGTPASIEYTVGKNPVVEAAKPPLHHLETTNQLFYEKKPAEATTKNPDYFKPSEPPKFANNTLAKEAAATASLEADPSLAGKGARGEMTRRPGESGNVYGVSVYVDEYAKWGTALKGVPLTETVSKKQTKYF